MKITLAQLNPVVGDVRGNLQKVVATLEQEHQNTDLVVFSELFLVGYPPRDLLEKPALIHQVQEALDHLVSLSARYPATGLLVGAPLPTGRDTGKGLCNCAVLIHQHRLQHSRIHGCGGVVVQVNRRGHPYVEYFRTPRRSSAARAGMAASGSAVSSYSSER